MILWFLGLIGAAAVYAAWPVQPPTPPPDDPPFPLPPFSETRFLHVNSDARYIGSSACAACHPNNHKSYLLTAHSRALSDVDPAAEPPDGAFDHKASGRSYRVYRKDGQLRHEEVLRTEAGKEVARTDLPVRYLVGSGHFSRTYVVEVDGFLHESPITWYASKSKWDMSPGYDIPNHPSFERPIQALCLRCHAGRFEAIDGTSHRITFHEKAIGCESCHGPGSQHQAFHTNGKLKPGEDDSTIVHPRKLSRPLAESICAECHLSSLATVPVRGRQMGDFRPGRPLTDYQINYRSGSGQEEMTVVGHVEQLRQSACYQKSPEMTCLTCHDPHAREKPKDPVAFYRQKCLDCHDTKPCNLPPDRRLKQNPADNCAACHMPRGDTDIPHIAFSHHRIGRHTARPQQPEDDRAVNLIPLDDNPHLSALDRQRNLGLAYYQFLDRTPVGARHAREYHDRARQHLEAVYKAGLRDAEIAYTLAELYKNQGEVDKATEYAREALTMKDLQPDRRARTLLLVGFSEGKASNYAAATGLIGEAVRLRRDSEDWRMLGMSHLNQDNPEKALPAFQQALTIRPYRPTTHLGLGEAYRRLGNGTRATEHFDKARWLFDHHQE